MHAEHHAATGGGLAFLGILRENPFCGTKRVGLVQRHAPNQRFRHLCIITAFDAEAHRDNHGFKSIE